MEQLDFLLVFTTDVKAHSCGVWCPRLVLHESERGHHEPADVQRPRPGWSTWVTS